MLNIVIFGASVLEKKTFKAFHYTLICKHLSTWGGPYMTQGTSYEKNVHVPAPRIIQASGS